MSLPYKTEATADVVKFLWQKCSTPWYNILHKNKKNAVVKPKGPYVCQHAVPGFAHKER